MIQYMVWIHEGRLPLQVLGRRDQPLGKATNQTFNSFSTPSFPTQLALPPPPLPSLHPPPHKVKKQRRKYEREEGQTPQKKKDNQFFKSKMRRRGGLYARLIYGSRAIPASRLLLFLSGICLMSMSALLIISSGLQPNIHKFSFKFDLPPSPFSPSTHKPPPSANSTTSAQGWFTSWRWRNPFSSNIAATEERSALPPLQPRCRVYTFYEKKAGAEGEIEDRMLLAWRRAFWAQGFKPIVLGMAEAKEHGLYPSVKKAELKAEFESELMRWLAWGRAGTGGVLIDHRVCCFLLTSGCGWF